MEGVKIQEAPDPVSEWYQRASHLLFTEIVEQRIKLIDHILVLSNRLIQALKNKPRS